MAAPNDKQSQPSPEQGESAHADGQPKRSAAAYFAVVVLSGALIAAVAVVVLSGGNEGAGEAVAAFEPEYSQLEARRQAAGVSTMRDPADASAHFHPRLAVYTNGERVQIPVNIGIDPTGPPDAMASLHTHESDGTIHVEGMSEATLGQLFEIWGVAFSEDELGPYQADGEKTVRMWVGGQPSEEFDDLSLTDGQEIVVAYGTPKQQPASLTP